MNEALYIGLISGTSRDGVDAVLVNIHGDDLALLHANCTPYPAAIRAEVDALIEMRCEPPAGRAASLDEQLGRFFARTARNLAEEAGVEMRDIRAIGSHGQTVWHDPEAARPVSIQLGSGSVIARTTGVTTVADFRRADLVAGGQGAPLAPLLHDHVFRSAEENRAVLNIGGISNITFLPPDGELSGYDCGPGNCLMDAWIQHVLDEAYDANGDWAASGKVSAELLESMLADEYFASPPPKSTGLEHFNFTWLQNHLDRCGELSDVDIQCTLAELTAITVADSLQAVQAERLLVCGGGVHNRHLIRRLTALLPDTRVTSTRPYGMDPDWVEAILFAWLARERLAGHLLNTAAVTGAGQPVLLGRIHRGTLDTERS